MRRHDEKARQDSFNRLVSSGIYTQAFDHSPALKAFVRRMLAQVEVEGGRRDGGPFRILDCGCGTGVWLQFLAGELGSRYGPIPRFGFDVSDAMVDLARTKLGGGSATVQIKRGDLLDPDSYRFEGSEDGFDLLFAFDVVQQLPPRHQFAACQQIVNRITPGGMALIFDHDKHSEYGRRMWRKKFLTRYFGLPLVPRYYCDARYPPLAEFARRLDLQPGVRASIVADRDTPKVALKITKAERY